MEELGGGSGVGGGGRGWRRVRGVRSWSKGTRVVRRKRHGFYTFVGPRPDGTQDSGWNIWTSQSGTYRGWVLDYKYCAGTGAPNDVTLHIY